MWSGCGKRRHDAEAEFFLDWIGPKNAPSSNPDQSRPITFTAQWEPLPKYTVTYSGDGVTTPAEEVESGTEITLAETPVRAGYTFTGWLCDLDGKTYQPDDDYTVTGNVTFTAQWTKNSDGTTPTPTTPKAPGGSSGSSGSGERGVILVRGAGGIDGGKPSAPPAPPESTGGTAAAPGSGGTWSDCAGDETCPVSLFTDVSARDWYHDGVHYCIENDLMGGYSDRTFRPDRPLTRAQLAQILYNLEGRPAVSADGGLTDVAIDAWCAGAVAWASEHGIVNGYGDGSFGPDFPISRQQLAVMLTRHLTQGA